MDPVALFEIGLSIFQQVSAAAHKQGLSDLAASVDAGLAELATVQGTDVTKSQLESLRG